MNLEESLARAEVTRRGTYAYVVHPLLDGVPRVEPTLLREAVDWFAAQPMLEDATLLVAPEAMALPLAAGVALRTGIPYVAARKRPYGRPGEVAVPTRTGYGGSVLHLNDIRSEDRVVVVDDVVSTGGTLDPLLAALRPRCRLLGALVLVDKGMAETVGRRHGVPVLAKHRIDVDDAVQVL